MFLLCTYKSPLQVFSTGIFSFRWRAFSHEFNSSLFSSFPPSANRLCATAFLTNFQYTLACCPWLNVEYDASTEMTTTTAFDFIFSDSSQIILNLQGPTDGAGTLLIGLHEVITTFLPRKRLTSFFRFPSVLSNKRLSYIGWLVS